MNAQAGFLLELLDVVALAAAEDLPIEMPQAVALRLVADGAAVPFGEQLIETAVKPPPRERRGKKA